MFHDAFRSGKSSSSAVPVKRVLGTTVLAALIVAPVGQAHAGEAEQKAQAIEIFKQGLELQSRGKVAQACEKFNESLRLSPSAVGPMMNTAACHAQAGRVASAWRLYGQAAQTATAAGRGDDAATASREAGSLLPRLPFLIVRVSSSAPASLQVFIDDTSIPADQWNKPIPVDPGPRTIRAAAPGNKAWLSTVEAAERSKTEVDIPMLEPEMPAGTSGPKLPPAPAREQGNGFSWSGRHTAATIAGGIGVVGLAVGAAYAVSASKTYDKSEPFCLNNVCSPDGGQYRDDAASKARVATVATGIGAAAVLGAVVLWVTAPSRNSSSGSAVFSPLVGPSTCGVMAEGRFW